MIDIEYKVTSKPERKVFKGDYIVLNGKTIYKAFIMNGEMFFLNLESSCVYSESFDPEPLHEMVSFNKVEKSMRSKFSFLDSIELCPTNSVDVKITITK